AHRPLHPFPTRRSSDLTSGFWLPDPPPTFCWIRAVELQAVPVIPSQAVPTCVGDSLCPDLFQPTLRHSVGLVGIHLNLSWILGRSEEHTSELQSRENLV